ncbi:DNA replication/repair protein RecF [Lichenicoccus sp.]|uniref:DNA replication/repair protein RecF n=1 Tax=Lichenicoccus sp. TaxID=2781899 RepID=UPI003D141A51
MLRLERLRLTDFRTYAHLVWQPRAQIVVLSGPNGSGKTNLLEALSLLVPGRGLRGARLGELPREGAAHWAVAARLAHAGEPFDLGTGTSPATPAGRRVFLLDGHPPRRGAVADALAAVWLTPQMDRLFVEGPAGRRRFLDRLVLALEPGHAREVAAHDEALAGRGRLLQGARAPDAGWLDAVEDALARHAVAVAAARRLLVARMNARAEASSGAFPPATLALDCPVADRLAHEPALAVEDWLRGSLRASRVADAAAPGARAALGAHRADLRLADLATGRPAAIASTGQQKALLLGVVLAHAALIAGDRGQAPLLLLDEPLVHLDATHRAALLAALPLLGAPALLTGTDAEPFAALSGHAEMLRAGCGKLVPAEGFPVL